MGLNSHGHGVTMGSSILKKEGDGRLLIEEFHFVSCMCVCVCVCVLGVFWLIFYCGLEYEVATSQL
jgi:hypothetical protein